MELGLRSRSLIFFMSVYSAGGGKQALLILGGFFGNGGSSETSSWTDICRLGAGDMSVNLMAISRYQCQGHKWSGEHRPLDMRLVTICAKRVRSEVTFMMPRILRESDMLISRLIFFL